jgi:hypothetical protein
MQLIAFWNIPHESQSVKISLALVGALNVHACDSVAGQEFSQS